LICLSVLQDPGNLESDLQSGAQTGYTLCWVIMWSTIMVHAQPFVPAFGVSLDPACCLASMAAAATRVLFAFLAPPVSARLCVAHGGRATGDAYFTDRQKPVRAFSSKCIEPRGGAASWKRPGREDRCLVDASGSFSAGLPAADARSQAGRGDWEAPCRALQVGPNF
jgi:hypothetical protein